MRVPLVGWEKADERRVEWTAKAADRLRDERRRRGERLGRCEAAVQSAAGVFTDAAAQANVAKVRIRTGFIATANRPDIAARDIDPARSPQRAVHNKGVMAATIASDVRRRAPLGQLVNRPGRALPLELAALAMAQLRPGGEIGDIGNIFGQPYTWSRLIADNAAAGQRRRHLTVGLGRLRALNLVELTSTRGGAVRYEPWRLLEEDLSGKHYQAPDPDDSGNDSISVPVGFFGNGWSNVLAAREIAVYLMVCLQAARLPRAHANGGVGTAPSVRRGVFGVTPEVYSAYNELVEFGLLIKGESANDRRAGRIRVEDAKAAQDGTLALEVEKFQLAPEGLKQNAYDVVSDRLKVLLPPRFGDFDPFIRAVRKLNIKI